MNTEILRTRRKSKITRQELVEHLKREEFEDLLHDLIHGARKLPETGEIMLEAALKIAPLAPVPDDLFKVIAKAQKEGILPTPPPEHHELHGDFDAEQIFVPNG